MTVEALQLKPCWPLQLLLVRVGCSYMARRFLLLPDCISQKSMIVLVTYTCFQINPVNSARQCLALGVITRGSVDVTRGT